MAKRWSGFVPQNISAKEEWALLEASQANRGDQNSYADLDWPQDTMSKPVRELRTLMELLQKTSNRQ